MIKKKHFAPKFFFSLCYATRIGEWGNERVKGRRSNMEINKVKFLVEESIKDHRADLFDCIFFSFCRCLWLVLLTLVY